MAASKVFISSSREDEPWKERLVSHLRALERQGTADIWDTSDIKAGANWAKQIEKAVHESNVAVLLISPSFLTSEFIVTKELPALLDRRQKEGLAIVPIMVRPTTWSEVPGIAELQFANDPSKPLSSTSEEERDDVYASISRQITELVEAVAERSATRSVVRPSGARPGRKRATEAPPIESAKGHLFVSHSKEDGDFAELLKLKLEREGHDAWIDTDRLDPGLDWRMEIDQAIKEATALLAIMSPDARASEYVTYEWAFAWGCGRKVIPIMLRQTTLHPRLATLQYLDFTNRTARPWRRLIQALAKVEENTREGLTRRSKRRAKARP